MAYAVYWRHNEADKHWKRAAEWFTLKRGEHKGEKSIRNQRFATLAEAEKHMLYRQAIGQLVKIEEIR